MERCVAVIDCGGTNLASVVFAFERLGVEVYVTRDEEGLERASHVILPGVGVCDEAMRKLDEEGLVEGVKNCGKPLLGICVGMQQLYGYSEEGDVDCLGIFEGESIKLSSHDKPVPHMGWNTLEVQKDSRLLAGIEGGHVYYVHSYYVPPDGYTVATSCYGMQHISAVVEKGAVCGCQFHPERSGVLGSRILRNFLSMGDEE
jgi:glutamine amidotransferase